MLVSHPSGQWLHLDIDTSGPLPGVWAVFYTEADCTGTAYDISYWNEPPNLLVLTGKIMDDRVFVARGLDEHVTVRSFYQWLPGQSPSFRCVAYDEVPQRRRRLESFPLSDLNLPSGPYHLEGQNVERCFVSHSTS